MNIGIDGIKINYEQYGQGADVLVLHGWGASIQTMRSIIDALKTSFRVTAIDFPGFGGSDAPPETYGVQEYADLTYKFIKELGLKKLHIINHSFGGRITLILAAQHPEIVDKIVFTDAAGIRKPRTTKQKVKIRMFKMAKRLNKGRVAKRILKLFGVDVEKHVKNAGSEDYRALPDHMKKVFVRVVNQDLRDFLPRIKSPSLLIWGEKDQDTPLEFAKIMEKEIPDAGLVVFEGAGHYSFLECFGRYIKIVTTFFGGK